MKQEPRFPELILASGSDTRQQLLARLKVPFVTHQPDIDESPLKGEHPAQMVERLSHAKADVIARRFPVSMVIGSDQAAVHEEAILGKPGTMDKAARQLQRFSGGRVDFITGLALHCHQTGHSAYLSDTTKVVFRQLSDHEIGRYLEADKPLDCAGSFRVESLGPGLFDSVTSDDPTALMGLPLIGLARLLRGAGFSIP